MTEENHCYQNAMAERVNGILKDEFHLDQTFDNVPHAKRAAKNAIPLKSRTSPFLYFSFIETWLQYSKLFIGNIFKKCQTLGCFSSFGTLESKRRLAPSKNVVLSDLPSFSYFSLSVPSSQETFFRSS